jgi:hypothetical protein
MCNHNSKRIISQPYCHKRLEAPTDDGIAVDVHVCCDYHNGLKLEMRNWNLTGCNVGSYTAKEVKVYVGKAMPNQKKIETK